MSAWIERIVQEFPVDLSHFWIACDPDDLLLDERMLLSLRERGFEVLPFEDSIAFRTEYEERYRAAWDRGEDGSAKALILQLHGSDVNVLPWDYIRDGRKVSLSLADLLPKLSYGVIRLIGSEYHDALFVAHCKYASQSLGEGETKNFILTHVYSFNPYLHNRPDEFWREILRLHYRGSGLPDFLAEHVVAILKDTELGELPIAHLLSSRTYTVRIIQDAWGHFLSNYGIRNTRAVDTNSTNVSQTFPIPFEHPDIRVIVDTMFLEGVLQPINIIDNPKDIPPWARVGVVSDPNAFGELVADGAKRISCELPSLDSSHRDWVELARHLGELIFRYNRLNAAIAASLSSQIRQLRRDADERLKDWVFRHFADLPSLPAVKRPVMVHHVPRYLASRRSAGEELIALLVFDGLSMDQWIQIREHLYNHIPRITVEESACFAWLPTLTSISRQALFSGLKPREFSNSIETTSQESSLWTRFWQDNGLRGLDVFYRKGIKRTEQLAELEEAISGPNTKVVGIVVDMIDEIIHGAMLGKRGVSGQIDAWCDTGFIEKLFCLLAAKGYQIYLTADHGNVEAEGMGRLNQGVISELRGERVRTYRSEAMAESVPRDIDAFRFDSAGLPPNFLPLYAGTQQAFIPVGEQIVAHGGISVEEVLVPFVRVTVTKENS